jgi:CRP-like cAMP-binding protein
MTGPRCGLMGALPAPERRQAARILRNAERVVLTAGERLPAARLVPAVVVVVRQGLVATVALAADDRRPVITALAGRESVLVPPRTGEVLLALDDSNLTLLGGAVYARLLGVPTAADTIARGLADAVRRARETLELFGSVSHTTRLREQLIQLARAHGRVRADGILIDLPLTHELLAWMVGSARETVTTTLGRLEDDGFVARTGRRYVLNFPPDAL